MFYIIIDKTLTLLLVKLGVNVQAPTASFTGGLVGDSSPFAVLPMVNIPILSSSQCMMYVACFLKRAHVSDSRIRNVKMQTP